MSGWLVVIETSGEEIVPPDEGQAVARPFRDYYAAWFDKKTDALKAVEKSLALATPPKQNAR
jgi:hypothetical protein